MPLQPLPAWKATLKALPPTGPGPAGMTNFANWYAMQIASIFPNPSMLIPSGFVFTFNVAIFKLKLLAAIPVPAAPAGIKAIADAWEAALMASIVIAGPGTSGVPATPATIFSVVASSIIDPPSIQLGKIHLLTLMGSAAGMSDQSKFPQVFREATLKLTMTAIGTNSITPTPTPLTIPNVGFT